MNNLAAPSRWMQAAIPQVVMVKTNDVAGWIEDPGFAPLPGFVAGFLNKLQAAGLDVCHLLIQLRALEIDDCL